MGDRVQVIAAVPCGECEYCQRGWQTSARRRRPSGTTGTAGWREYIVIPEEVLKVDGLNRIEDHVSFAEASVAEPFACALNAQELANVGDVGCRSGCKSEADRVHPRAFGARARGAREVYLIELSRSA